MNAGTTVDRDLMRTLESEVGVLLRRIKRVVCERATEVHPELQSGAWKTDVKTVARPTPAASAIASIELATYPRSMNNVAAASTMPRRVAAACAVRRGE